MILSTRGNSGMSSTEQEQSRSRSHSMPQSRREVGRVANPPTKYPIGRHSCRFTTDSAESGRPLVFPPKSSTRSLRAYSGHWDWQLRRAQE